MTISGLCLAVLDSSYGDVSIERTAAEPLGVAVYDVREADSMTREPDGVLVQFATIGADELDAHPTWRVVGRYGVGVDTIDVGAATERGIPVVNVPDYCDEEVSTHAAALVLALARKLLASAALVSEGRWSDWNELRPIRPLSDCTLGLLGVGRIGRATIERLRPFFGSIIAHDPVATSPSGVVAVGLEELFRGADVLSLHCPLSAETHHVVDASRLAAMPSGSLLVNVSRGGLVDASALADALRSGHLAGAAVDVLEIEPPPADDPFVDAPNLIVTNHIGWYSTASEGRLRRLLAERCAAVLIGTPVATVVNGASLGRPT